MSSEVRTFLIMVISSVIIKMIKIRYSEEEFQANAEFVDV